MAQDCAPRRRARRRRRHHVLGLSRATARMRARRTGSRAPGRPSTARRSSGSGTRWRSRTGATRLRSRARPDLAKIALEAHPGFLVYNPETVLRLREAAGPEIGANFDPSHFVWQGIDPLAAVRTLGKAGAIFHVHAKDVYLDRANISVNGVLDTKHYGRFAERSWSFRSVGYGQDEKFWRDFVSALRIAGYDGVLSIEHEDGLAVDRRRSRRRRSRCCSGCCCASCRARCGGRRLLTRSCSEHAASTRAATESDRLSRCAPSGSPSQRGSAAGRRCSSPFSGLRSIRASRRIRHTGLARISSSARSTNGMRTGFSGSRSTGTTRSRARASFRSIRC